MPSFGGTRFLNPRSSRASSHHGIHRRYEPRRQGARDTRCGSGPTGGCVAPAPTGSGTRVPAAETARESERDLDGLDYVEGVDWAVADDVVMDLEEPALRLSGPDYLRQDSIRRAISSFEMVLPASESAIPRSTMAANASSLRISSSELSSGWSSMRRMSWAFAGPWQYCSPSRVPRRGPPTTGVKSLRSGAPVRLAGGRTCGISACRAGVPP